MTNLQADQALGAYLVSLRVSAGLEPAVLARRVSLSTAQLGQLETGQGSLFYNRKIRQQAARKVILQLGGDPTQADDIEEVSSKSPQADPVQAEARPDASAAEPLPEKTSPAPIHRRSALLAGAMMVAVVSAGIILWMGREAPPVTASAPETHPLLLKAESAMPVAREPVATAPEPQTNASLQPEPAAAQVIAQLAPVEPPPCGGMSSEAPVVQPPQARKPGDMVYVVSEVDQVLCVVDAKGKREVKRFKAGEALSFYGQPPWQLQSSQLRETQLFFQGWKVRLPADAQDRVQLVELR